VLGGGAAYRLTPEKQTTLRDYLNAGGNLIYVGGSDVDFAISNYQSWADTIFHISYPPGIDIQTFKNRNLDFKGAKGSALGYPDLMLDPAKSHPDSISLCDSLPALRGIFWNFPRGFAEAISFFDSNCNNPAFENFPLGIRFVSPDPPPNTRATYSIVYFPHPLWRMDSVAVQQALQKAFIDVREP
jgi:hypothetical protein